MTYYAVEWQMNENHWQRRNVSVHRTPDNIVSDNILKSYPKLQYGIISR
jgi:hypothetical protein